MSESTPAETKIETNADAEEKVNNTIIIRVYILKFTEMIHFSSYKLCLLSICKLSGVLFMWHMCVYSDGTVMRIMRKKSLFKDEEA